MEPILKNNKLHKMEYVKKDGLKLLVNIHDYILEVIELPENTSDKKFTYGNNNYKQLKKIK